MGKIEIVLGDITKIRVDAIVNAANKSLLKGGGVDGAIHRAAGSELELECKDLGSCPMGEARITKSYCLEKMGIGWVIHAVGPRWLGGVENEEKLLENAYKSSLELAENYAGVYPRQCLTILENYIAGIDEKAKVELRQEVLDMANLYVNSHPIKTIAFPSISTGIYHFPLEKAAPIAISTIKKFLENNEVIEKVVLVCFDNKTYESYQEELNK